MSEWFLTADERGNPATDIDRDGSWVAGNSVRLLIHGATYFQRLYDELCALRAGDRGTPIYVHAKVCVVDDEWFTCGSDNFNRRSWTNDSELTCAVVGGGLAREVRSELWTEHLGGEPELDPVKGFERWTATAAALDDWHAAGRVGARPAGQIRRHEPAGVGRFARLWARQLYHHVYDPDGRPRRLRLRNSF